MFLASAFGRPVPVPCHHTRGPMARLPKAAQQKQKRELKHPHNTHKQICSSALPPPPRMSTWNIAAPEQWHN